MDAKAMARKARRMRRSSLIASVEGLQSAELEEHIRRSSLTAQKDAGKSAPAQPAVLGPPARKKYRHYTVADAATNRFTLIFKNSLLEKNYRQYVVGKSVRRTKGAAAAFLLCMIVFGLIEFWAGYSGEGESARAIAISRAFTGLVPIIFIAGVHREYIRNVLLLEAVLTASYAIHGLMIVTTSAIGVYYGRQLFYPFSWWSSTYDMVHCAVTQLSGVRFVLAAAVALCHPLLVCLAYLPGDRGPTSDDKEQLLIQLACIVVCLGVAYRREAMERKEFVSTANVLADRTMHEDLVNEMLPRSVQEALLAKPDERRNNARASMSFSQGRSMSRRLSHGGHEEGGSLVDFAMAGARRLSAMVRADSTVVLERRPSLINRQPSLMKPSTLQIGPHEGTARSDRSLALGHLASVEEMPSSTRSSEVTAALMSARAGHGATAREGFAEGHGGPMPPAVHSGRVHVTRLPSADEQMLSPQAAPYGSQAANTGASKRSSMSKGPRSIRFEKRNSMLAGRRSIVEGGLGTPGGPLSETSQDGASWDGPLESQRASSQPRTQRGPSLLEQSEAAFISPRSSSVPPGARAGRGSMISRTSTASPGGAQGVHSMWATQTTVQLMSPRPDGMRIMQVPASAVYAASEAERQQTVSSSATGPGKHGASDNTIQVVPASSPRIAVSRPGSAAHSSQELPAPFSPSSEQSMQSDMPIQGRVLVKGKRTGHSASYLSLGGMTEAQELNMSQYSLMGKGQAAYGGDGEGEGTGVDKAAMNKSTRRISGMSTYLGGVQRVDTDGEMEENEPEHAASRFASMARMQSFRSAAGDDNQAGGGSSSSLVGEGLLQSGTPARQPSSMQFGVSPGSDAGMEHAEDIDVSPVRPVSRALGDGLSHGASHLFQLSPDASPPKSGRLGPGALFDQDLPAVEEHGQHEAPLEQQAAQEQPGSPVMSVQRTTLAVPALQLGSPMQGPASARAEAGFPDSCSGRSTATAASTATGRAASVSGGTATRADANTTVSAPPSGTNSITSMRRTSQSARDIATAFGSAVAAAPGKVANYSAKLLQRTPTAASEGASLSSYTMKAARKAVKGEALRKLGTSHRSAGAGAPPKGDRRPSWSLYNANGPNPAHGSSFASLGSGGGTAVYADGQGAPRRHSLMGRSFMQRQPSQPEEGDQGSSAGPDGPSWDPVAYLYPAATVMFVYVSNMSTLSSRAQPLDLITFLNRIYSQFDVVVSSMGAYKVMAIANMYLVVAGAPDENEDHASVMARVALGIMKLIKREHANMFVAKVRAQFQIGLHSGELAAGVIGQATLNWHIFGDTVNTASRMTSNNESGRIQVSPVTADLLKRDAGMYGPPSMCGTGVPTLDEVDAVACGTKVTLSTLGGIRLECRGLTSFKGKGNICSWWLSDPELDALTRAEAMWVAQEKRTKEEAKAARRRSSVGRAALLNLLPAAVRPNVRHIGEEGEGHHGGGGLLGAISTLLPHSSGPHGEALSPKSLAKTFSFIGSKAALDTASTKRRHSMGQGPAGATSPRGGSLSPASPTASKSSWAVPPVPGLGGDVPAHPPIHVVEVDNLDAGLGLGMGESRPSGMGPRGMSTASVSSRAPTTADKHGLVVVGPREPAQHSPHGAIVRAHSDSAAGPDASAAHPYAPSADIMVVTNARSAGGPDLVPHDVTTPTYALSSPSQLANGQQAGQEAELHLVVAPTGPGAKRASITDLAGSFLRNQDASAMVEEEPMHPLLLSFTDAEVEAAYQAKVRGRMAKKLFRAFVLGSIVAAGSVLKSAWFDRASRGPDYANYVGTSRGILTGMSLLVLVYLGRQIQLLKLGKARAVEADALQGQPGSMLSVASTLSHSHVPGPWAGGPLVVPSLLLCVGFSIALNTELIPDVSITGTVSGSGLANINFVLILCFSFLELRAYQVALLNAVCLAIYIVLLVVSERYRAMDVVSHVLMVTVAAGFSAVIAYVRESARRLRFNVQRKARTHKEKCEAMLLNMLPSAAHAARLMRGEQVVEELPDVTLLYSDIRGFTQMSSAMSADSLIDFLDALYASFDMWLPNFGVYKIETVGDAFIVVGGLLQDSEMADGSRAGSSTSMAVPKEALTGGADRVDTGSSEDDGLLGLGLSHKAVAMKHTLARLITQLKEGGRHSSKVSPAPLDGGVVVVETDKASEPEHKPPAITTDVAHPSATVETGDRPMTTASDPAGHVLSNRSQGRNSSGTITIGSPGHRDSGVSQVKRDSVSSDAVSAVSDGDAGLARPSLAMRLLPAIPSSHDVHAAALPVPAPRDRPPISHVGRTALFAVLMLDLVKQLGRELSMNVQIRVGIHCGKVVGGIIGRTRPRYFVWGSDCDLANKMESSGVAMQVQVSEVAAHRLAREGFILRPYQQVDIRDDGAAPEHEEDSDEEGEAVKSPRMMQTYLLIGCDRVSYMGKDFTATIEGHEQHA